jgi:hypothetical protein
MASLSSSCRVQTIVADGQRGVLVTLPKLVAKPRHLVFALDKSGSMGATGMTALKNAVKCIEADKLPTDTITYALYDSTCRIVSADDVYDSRAGGGTNFANVWQMLAVSVPLGEDVVFTLMTDGQDNSRRSAAQMGARVAGMLSEFNSLTVSTLGFGCNVNTDFLRQMRQDVFPEAIDAGHFDANNASELKHILGGLFAVGSTEKMVRMQLDGEQHIVAQNVSAPGSVVSQFFFLGDTPLSTITVNDRVFDIVDAKEEDDDIDLLLMTYRAMIASGKYRTAEDLNRIDTEQIAPLCGKSRLAVEIRGEIDVWRSILLTNSAASLDDHETLKKLIRDVKFKSASKKRKATKMRLRGQQMIKTAKDRVKPITLVSLRTIEEHPVAGWTCPLSLNTVLETHEDGDFVGICITLELPQDREVVLMAPEALRLVSVSGNLLYSYSAWSDIVQHAEQEGKQHNEAVCRDANGQMPTGFIPLSFTDDHFNRCLKPMLPFMLAATFIGDPLAIDARQNLALAGIYGKLLLDANVLLGDDVAKHVLPAIERVVRLGCIDQVRLLFYLLALLIFCLFR